VTNEEQEARTRQEARDEKLRKKKERMKQHGKGLGKIYRDAITKKGAGK
jgi:hypothetical protein